MLAELANLLELSVFITVVIIAIVRLLPPKTDQREGKLVVRIGSREQVYPYAIGNRIYTGMGMCNAIVIRLPQRVPHMVIDSHKNDREHTGLPCQPLASQRLQLEGVTYKDFAFYTPKGIERQALEFLTPDVMQVLIDNGSRYDVEFFVNQITIMSNQKLQATDGSLDALMGFAQQFMAEIGHKLQTWNQQDAGEVAGTYLKFDRDQAFKFKWHTIDSRRVGSVGVFVLVMGTILAAGSFGGSALTMQTVLWSVVVAGFCAVLASVRLP